jgi:DNA repair exonuclease SbcCD ATPase subunit
MKKLTTLIPCALLAFTAHTVTATDNNQYMAMHKQLEIMSNIIKSSVSMEEGQKNSKITSIESTYLKGQGIVFTINSKSGNNQWGNFNFNFTMPDFPIMPRPPRTPDFSSRQSDDSEFEAQINKSVARSMENAAQAYEHAMESFEHNRENFRELREEQRDLSYELRDVTREKRDLEYQLLRADNDDKKELKAELSELSQQEKRLLAHQQEFAEKNEKLQKKHQAEQVKQEKVRSAYYQNLKVSLAETLCLYGNGLKALPKNEHVSVILKSAGNKVGRRYKDSILVFNKKDISDCSAEKISVAKLNLKSQNYQF